MSEEQNIGKPALDHLVDAPKRRRIPSQYASQIQDFKNVTLPSVSITPAKSKKTDWEQEQTLLRSWNPRARPSSAGLWCASCLLESNMR